LRLRRARVVAEINIFGSATLTFILCDGLTRLLMRWYLLLLHRCFPAPGFSWAERLNHGRGAGRDSNPAHQPLSHFATAKNYFLWPKHFTSSKRLTSVGDSRGSFLKPVEKKRVHGKWAKRRRKLDPFSSPYHKCLNGQKPFHAKVSLL
jgi:hypothetical protein